VASTLFHYTFDWMHFSLLAACAGLLVGLLYFFYAYRRLRARNRSLRHELRRRALASETLNTAKAEVEKRERARSEDLARVNQALMDEVNERERTEKARLLLQHEADQLRQAAASSRSIHHDLNNQLAIIIPSVQLALEECPQAAPAREHLEQILSTALRARAILRPQSHGSVKVHRPVPQSPLPEELVGASGPKGRGQHILLVDDEPAVVRALAKYLEMSSYKVTVCTHPKMALDLFLANPKAFDMVITDRAMPDISGTELSRKMVEARPDIPVLLITGYGVDLDPQHVHRSGIRKVLAKPVPLRTLLQHIDEQWQVN
jgi:CheY-like chemotaxis protein